MKIWTIWHWKLQVKRDNSNNIKYKFLISLRTNKTLVMSSVANLRCLRSWSTIKWNTDISTTNFSRSIRSLLLFLRLHLQASTEASTTTIAIANINITGCGNLFKIIVKSIISNIQQHIIWKLRTSNLLYKTKSKNSKTANMQTSNKELINRASSTWH